MYAMIARKGYFHHMASGSAILTEKHGVPIVQWLYR
jgi:hypothetical protein